VILVCQDLVMPGQVYHCGSLSAFTSCDVATRGNYWLSSQHWRVHAPDKLSWVA
jgi:hypothetical protein